jgi:oligoendopeptidase F
MLVFWPYMAVVDAFQHWVYTHPTDALNPANCDAKWGELWSHFKPGVDWSGLEDIRLTGWQRKLHIFQAPFYYVDYGMAQLGAAQVWANSMRDQAGAVAAYRKALALGGTVSIPAFFKAANANFTLDSNTVQRLVDLIEEQINELEHV